MGSGSESLPGWVFKPTPTRTIHVDVSCAESTSISGSQVSSGWEYLDAEGVRALEGTVAGQIERRLMERDTGGKAQVAVLPTKWV